MNVNWETIMRRLQAYPAGIHELIPLCSQTELARLSDMFGPVPRSLAQMLRHFNGARLFIRPNGGGEFITVFGATDLPPPPPLVEPSGWSIDKFTSRWRSAKDPSRDRSGDWAIGVMNYGGLIVLGSNEKVREWDTAQAVWDSKELDIPEWIENLFQDGDAFLREP